METGDGSFRSTSDPARGPNHFPFQGLKDSGIGSTRHLQQHRHDDEGQDPLSSTCQKPFLLHGFISIPKDMGTFNCGAFVAGIVRGVLDGAGFPAVVTAHFVPMEGQHRPRTTILIKFGEEPSVFSNAVKSSELFSWNPVSCSL
ncbi:hypothetical protein NC653_040026 [Populus alba x Populus x berolinensis]|uniref:Trafficking protein particle complex subunit 5 n=1 Tax=Populus alba x Populus x berolinensis TaxID=444605 RepID=A0AAD6LCR3_9ROSI|nr:hypothetical protein NC653_040026 [Populus alba x Populus x berolinensis]